MKIASYNTFFSDLKLHGFEYALAHTAALGYDGVEILYLSGRLASLDDAKRARERFDAYGLDVVCYSVCVNLTPDRSAIAEAELRHHAALASILGSPYLHHTLACALRKSDNAPAYDDIFDHVLQTARRVADACAEQGLTCLYEPQGLYFNGIDGLGRFFTEIKRTHGNVGICGDMGNSLFVGCDPVSVFAHFKDDIRHLHAKNFLITSQNDPDHKCFPLQNGTWLCDVGFEQQGAVDLCGCLSALDKLPTAISIETDGTDEVIGAHIKYLRSITA